MKIAILGTRGIPSGYSGYEAFAEEVGSRFVSSGITTVVYAHANRFKNKPHLYRGIKMKYIPCMKGKNTSQFSHSMLCSLHAIFIERPDIALFCNAANGPFGLLFKLGFIKSAINVDGLEWLRPKWSSLAKKYFKFGAKCATLFFDKVITDAKGMQDYYKKEFNCDSIDIAYGADIKYSENVELVRNLGLEPNKYYLIASRLVPDNNADLIVKAFHESGSNLILAIAGGANYKNPFESELRKQANDKIKFLGHIDDSETIKELHCNAFAYLHGHEFGGTNPALLKALAYGNCILALDTVFNREVLVDGKYGILFKKESSDLSKKIKEIERNQGIAENYRSLSRERIQQNYSWEKITQQYIDLFNSIYKT